MNGKNSKKNLTISIMLLILEFSPYLKSSKVPSLIYTYFESLNKKANSCKCNLEKSCTTKLGEHIPCVHSMSMIWTFDGMENRHDA